MTAYVHPTAVVGGNYQPAPFTIIDAEVDLRPNVISSAPSCSVRTAPASAITCSIGDHVTIHDGAVIGAGCVSATARGRHGAGSFPCGGGRAPGDWRGDRGAVHHRCERRHRRADALGPRVGVGRLSIGENCSWGRLHDRPNVTIERGRALPTACESGAERSSARGAIGETCPRRLWRSATPIQRARRRAAPVTTRSRDRMACAPSH